MDKLIEWFVRTLVWLSRWARPLSRIGLVKYATYQPGKPLKLLLVGYNGARNTGADARVVALVEQLTEAFGREEIEMTVMTLNAENVSGYFPDHVRVLPFPTFFCWSLFRAASAHHAAILCEGSTLTHTFADALSMFFCEAAGIMKRQGKPCIAYGSDVTRLQPRLARLSKTMCSDVHFIARSQSALEVLQEMGFTAHLGTDTAWTFCVPEEKDNAREALMRQGWDGRKPLLGVAIINPYCWPVRPSFWRWTKAVLLGQRALQYDKMYFFSDSSERREKYYRYLAQMAEAAKAYRDAHDAFVVIIGMEKLDAQACRNLRALLDKPCASLTSLDHDVFAMTSVLHQLDALITSRYHAAVLSMLKAMPVVAVSMDNRLDGLFHDIGFSGPSLRQAQDKLSSKQVLLHHVDDEDLAKHIILSLEEADAKRNDIIATIRQHAELSRATLKEMSEFLTHWIKSEILQK